MNLHHTRWWHLQFQVLSFGSSQREVPPDKPGASFDFEPADGDGQGVVGVVFDILKIEEILAQLFPQ